MATKTIRVSEGDDENFYRVPCDDTSVGINGIVNVIPTTWVEIEASEHNGTIVPCITAKVTRIFCPPVSN